MANAIEKLREGIIDASWILICSAYEDLTAEVLDPPSSNINCYRETIDKIKNLCSLLDNSSEDTLEQSKKQVKNTPKPPKAPKNETMTKGKKIPTNNKPGHFGNETVLITEPVSEQDIIETQKKFKQKEVRPPTKMFDVVCSVCTNGFKSYIPPSDETGQRCVQCMKEAIKNAK